MTQKPSIPAFSKTLFAIWSPAGGPEDTGAWWQSDGCDWGEAPMVFTNQDQAMRGAKYECEQYNDGERLYVVNVSDPANPVIVGEVGDDPESEELI